MKLFNPSFFPIDNSYYQDGLYWSACVGEEFAIDAIQSVLRKIGKQWLDARESVARRACEKYGPFEYTCVERHGLNGWTFWCKHKDDESSDPRYPLARMNYPTFEVGDGTISVVVEEGP